MRSKDDKLREESEYYLNVLLKCGMEAEASSCEEVCAIPLSKLLVFPRVRGLCGEDGLQDIR